MMADALDELTEDLSLAASSVVIGGGKSNGSNVVVDHDFDDIKNDPFFSDHSLSSPVHIDDAHCCKLVLYQPLSANVRLWDALILLPTLLFLLFLLARFSQAQQKLRATHSPVFRAFYALVLTSAVVSVVRCLVSMSVSAASPAGDQADKVLWILLRFFLLATEMSVLVFGLASGHLDSRRSIRRVVAVTACVSLAFSLTQGVLELDFPDPNFHVEAAKLNLFGHGGMLFWLVSSALFSAVYLTVLLLPFLPCRHYLSLPHKRSFYRYVGFLLFLNGVQTTGSILVYAGVADGLCLVNLATFLYFTAFTPVVYFTFLRGFFRVAQPTLLFSYKTQVDEFEAEMPQSASLQFRPADVPADPRDESSTPIILNSAEGFPRRIVLTEAAAVNNMGIASPESVVNYNFG